LAAKARRLMVENLWFSAMYNAIAVPLAVLGFVTPLIAALAMSGSSILVTLNALRARNAGRTA
jgi:P-type Cu2+ transporter